MTKPENAGSIQRGRFQPGRSGNPAGKPKGARNRATRAAEALLDGESEELTRKAIELAKAGDGTALRLCLERLIPARRDRPVNFDLPAIETANDAAKAMGAILQAVAAGEISPSEGAEVARLLESFTKALEIAAFEQRLTALENRKAK
jgi:hypothetical protein